jgi:GT2 family glycosyltransferase
MKVLMCIPFTGYVPPLAAYSLIPMACQARKEGIEIGQLPYGMSLVYIAREEAAKAMRDFDYLLFIDSDMTVPVDLITRLVSHDKPIVSALAFRRSPGYEPCIFNKLTDTEATFYHDYPKGLIEVAGTGMACTLIKREVFEKTPQPWFFPTKELGEDLIFCKRVREAGFKIYCDTELICGHVGFIEVKEAHYRRSKC